jgi:polyisoprenoid-binding protein YceI
MTALSNRLLLSNLIFALLVPSFIAAAGNEVSGMFDIDSGAASFESATNVPGVEVKGKSNSLTGHLTITRDEHGLTLEGIDVSLPVKTLATGMKVRDEHMRKYIFTTGDGQLPDLRFSADSLTCPVNASSQESTCQIAGQLNIRGIAHQFAMNLNVRAQSGTTFHGAGDAVVRLSDYGITPPSQFGVSASNEVKLHIDFAARQRPVAISSTEHAR